MAVGALLRGRQLIFKIIARNPGQALPFIGPKHIKQPGEAVIGTLEPHAHAIAHAGVKNPVRGCDAPFQKMIVRQRAHVPDPQSGFRGRVAAEQKLIQQGKALVGPPHAHEIVGQMGLNPFPRLSVTAQPRFAQPGQQNARGLGRKAQTAGGAADIAQPRFFKVVEMRCEPAHSAGFKIGQGLAVRALHKMQDADAVRGLLQNVRVAQFPDGGQGTGQQGIWPFRIVHPGQVTLAGLREVQHEGDAPVPQRLGGGAGPRQQIQNFLAALAHIDGNALNAAKHAQIAPQRLRLFRVPAPSAQAGQQQVQQRQHRRAPPVVQGMPHFFQQYFAAVENGSALQRSHGPQQRTRRGFRRAFTRKSAQRLGPSPPEPRARRPRQAPRGEKTQNFVHGRGRPGPQLNQRLPRVADFIHGQQRGQSLRQGFLRIMDHLLVLFSDLIQILDKIHVTNKPEKKRIWNGEQQHADYTQ